jgi:hypothetical protein
MAILVASFLFSTCLPACLSFASFPAFSACLPACLLLPEYLHTIAFLTTYLRAFACFLLSRLCLELRGFFCLPVSLLFLACLSAYVLLHACLLFFLPLYSSLPHLACFFHFPCLLSFDYLFAFACMPTLVYLPVCLILPASIPAYFCMAVLCLVFLLPHDLTF